MGNGATQADDPRGSLYQKSVRGARTSVAYTFAGKEREQYIPSKVLAGCGGIVICRKRRF